MPFEPLPTFKYHPDPVATGSIVRSRKPCVVCGESRGYAYHGPMFGEEDLSEAVLCPWCIADGSAHDDLGVEFIDPASVPGTNFDGAPGVPDRVIEELSRRTPGFTAWQESEWFTCCNDASTFLGRMGTNELQMKHAGALASLRAMARLDDDDDGWEALLERLDADAGPTAYVFRCPHCGKYGAYYDSD